MLPNIRFEPTRAEARQDMQGLHQARRRLGSQMRGLVQARGVPIALSTGRARRTVREMPKNQCNGPNEMSHGQQERRDNLDTVERK